MITISTKKNSNVTILYLGKWPSRIKQSQSRYSGRKNTKVGIELPVPVNFFPNLSCISFVKSEEPSSDSSLLVCSVVSRRLEKISQGFSADWLDTKSNPSTHLSNNRGDYEAIEVGL